MEEWVTVILLLSNQSEVPKAYYTEKQTKKKNYFQHPKCPNWLTAWTESSSWSMTRSKLTDFKCERPSQSLLFGEHQKRWRWRGWLLDAESGCWIYKASACAHAVRSFRQEGCRINTSLQTHSSLQGCVGETWRQMKSELFLSSSGAAEHHGYISTTRKKSHSFGSY